MAVKRKSIKPAKTRLTGITVKCECGHDLSLELGQFYIDGWEAECDLCGGHSGVNINTRASCADGKTIVNIVCPGCGKPINSIDNDFGG